MWVAGGTRGDSVTNSEQMLKPCIFVVFQGILCGKFLGVSCTPAGVLGSLRASSKSSAGRFFFPSECHRF